MNFKIALLAVFIFFISCDNPDGETTTWEMESLEAIDGNNTMVWGNPELTSGEEEKAIEFDGKGDGILVDSNPIAGMEEFTIEVDFMPYRSFPENIEQRFLHIQDPDNENRRILIELRLNDRDEWYGDWFIKAEDEDLALIDSTKTHPVDEWATVSLVYKQGQLDGYVNGEREVSGQIKYLPISKKGKTSVGTRMDKRSWFKGAIREIRFSPSAIDL